MPYHTEYSDFTILSSDGLEFPVHRVYLAKYEHFKNLFDSFNEGRSVNLDYTSKVINYIIRGIYGDYPSYGELDLDDIYNVIKFYHNLLFSCERSIIDRFVKLYEEIIDEELSREECSDLLFKLKSVSNVCRHHKIYFKIRLLPEKICDLMTMEEIDDISSYDKHYFKYESLRQRLPRPKCVYLHQDLDKLRRLYGKEYISYRRIEDGDEIHFIHPRAFATRLIYTCRSNDIYFKNALIGDLRTNSIDLDRSKMPQFLDPRFKPVRDMKIIVNLEYRNSVLCTVLNADRWKDDLSLQVEHNYDCSEESESDLKICDIYEVIYEIPEHPMIPNPYGVQE